MDAQLDRYNMVVKSDHQSPEEVADGHTEIECVTTIGMEKTYLCNDGNYCLYSDVEELVESLESQIEQLEEE